jgi:putative peptidoglycan lipid II flippase
MTKARLLGTTALSDTFSVAFMIPNLFRRLFAEGSIAVAFIPTFKKCIVEDSKDEIRNFLSCVFTFLTFLVTAAVVIGILLSPLIVSLFGLKEFDETVLLTRIMFPFLAFISIAAFFQGILNSIGVFTPSGAAPILLNIMMIVCAYALKDLVGNSARAMAIGVLIGGFLEAGIQLPFIMKKGFSFFFTSIQKAVKHPGTQTILKLIGPTVVGMAAYQLNDLASTALAGNAGQGVVSSLQYSLRLQELILGVFAVSIGTVLLPDFAEYAKTNNWNMFNARLQSAVNIIAFITVPITFFAICQGETLIRLLFQGRSFTEESVALTKTAFTFHAPALLFIALNRILAPAFYAQSDTKSPTLAGIISFAVNIALASVMARKFRGAGIAFALTVASAINTILLFYFLKKKPFIQIGGVLKPILYIAKLCLFSMIALIPVLLLNQKMLTLFVGYNRFVHHGFPFVIAASVFFSIELALLILTKDVQTRKLISIVKFR